KTVPTDGGQLVFVDKSGVRRIVELPADETDRIDMLLALTQDDDSEVGLVFRRTLERMKAGADTNNAWRLALAEQLTKTRREHWSRKLLEQAANLLLEECEPKLRREWERENKPKRDREVIDAVAKHLKAQGCRDAKTEAEKRWARAQGVTVHALRQRRYRPSGSRRRRSKV